MRRTFKTIQSEDGSLWVADLDFAISKFMQPLGFGQGAADLGIVSKLFFLQKSWACSSIWQNLGVLFESCSVFLAAF